MDGQGEVIPRADAFVAEVVDAGHDAVADGGVDGACQVACVGGGAYLVEHHAQRLALAPQAEHGLHEVVAVFGVKPGGADDHRAGAAAHHLLFARQLGAPVDGVRARLVVLGVRHVGGAVEDVIRGYVYQGGAARLGGICQVGGCQVVQLLTQAGVVLGLVYGGVGRAVHDEVYGVAANEVAHALLVADVQLLHVGEEVGVLRVSGGQIPHGVAKLTVGSGYQNVHISRQILVLLFCPCHNSLPAAR